MKKSLAILALAFSYVVVGCMPNVDETNNPNPDVDREILMYIVGYIDSDGDGYSPVASAEAACDLLREDLRARCMEMFQNGEVATVAGPLQFGDCLDSNPGINPGATEICDDKDNDCDGQTDEGLESCQCVDNDDCPVGQMCSNNHSCIPTSCDDGDVCTTDSRQANGTCTTTPVQGCCNTDAQCAVGQYCVDASHECATVPGCGDDNACTTDTFDMATEKCINTQISGCQCDADNDCGATERCNMTSHVCEQVPCPDDADACTREEVISHECKHTPITGCNQCTTDAQCAALVPTGFSLQSGGWWHLGNVSYGCLAGLCGSCVDNDNDGYCAECVTGADCPAGQVCKDFGVDDACVPQECGTGLPACPSGQECVSGLCQSTTCTPSCSGKECGDNGCGGSCGACGTDEACSAGQCVAGNTCTTNAQCADTDSATADLCFQGTCHHVAPGQCGPFGVKFVPVGQSGGPLEWWKAGSGGSPRTQNSVGAGTYLSQPGECSVGVYNFHLTESRCLTANGESPLRELPASPGIWGCVFNQ